MSYIKKLKYSDGEVTAKIESLLNSLNKSLFEGGIVKFDDILLLGEKEGQKLLVEVKEQTDDWLVLRIEFSTPANKNVGELGGDEIGSGEAVSEEYTEAKKFYVQIDKQSQTGQTTLYKDYIDEQDDLELPEDYKDYRLYEELNQLLINSIGNYLEPESSESEEEDEGFADSENDEDEDDEDDDDLF